MKKITTSLQAKLVTLVQHCEMERRGLLVATAQQVRNRLLDDAEVAEWINQNKDQALYNVRAPR